MINKIIKIGKISTSRVELVDITKAWIMVALTFTFLFSGVNLADGTLSFSKLESSSFWLLVLISLFTAGIGFLLHELAHKFSAQHYGCAAEFRSFDQMLFFALLLAVGVGFTFIAPGAVMISGMITRKENGIISLAGPIVNYILALLFLGLMFFIPAGAFFFSIGFQINLWLGLFNMIPFMNFDGAKIWHWNIPIWIAMVGFGVFFLFFLGRMI
ncbi:MAG: metalloprotease [Nanoarchaeota archaeon]